MKVAAAALAGVLAACAAAPPHVPLGEDWPAKPGDYKRTTADWTRTAELRGEYQDVMDLSVIFKSTPWRASHAERDADHRGLSGDARARVIAQAQADAAGPYEVEMLLTTWDRRENDLDRGKHSVWKVTLIDETGHEIEPIEIVKDKRPPFTLRAEFPTLGDFATAYVARFPRSESLFGATAKRVRMRVSGERGGVEVAWDAP